MCVCLCTMHGAVFVVKMTNQRGPRVGRQRRKSGDNPGEQIEQWHGAIYAPLVHISVYQR